MLLLQENMYQTQEIQILQQIGFILLCNTDTATTGGIEGGGYPVSVGPVTIEA